MLLDQFDPTKLLCIDIESISFDDEQEAFRPYHGHRIAGFYIVQDGVPSMYVPLRHRTEIDQCLPFDSTIAEIREFATKCEHVVNQNIKFDLHFFAQDGVEFPKAKFYDTMTLARLVNNQLPEYNLDALTKRYCTKHVKEGEPISEWCKEHKTKDYGAVPIALMREYANKDVLSTLELYHELRRQLPEESYAVWQEEVKFCRILFESERHGVLIDPTFFKQVECMLLGKMVKTQEKITALAGYELNPGSWPQKNLYFQSQGVEPVAWNENEETGENTPCWDADALALIIHPMANLLTDYTECNTALGTFCQGWPKQADANNIMHPNFKSSGTKTGRISCEKPNMQNPPKWAMRGIIIPEGEIGVKFDYSQIEYRLFAHFSKDEALLKAYADNPKIDFHQRLADRLGLIRDVIKPINFGILYGMGKKKLKKSIAKLINDLQPEADDPKFAEKQDKYQKLIDYLQYKYGGTLDEIAEKILVEYHQQVPAVKLLLDRVKQTIHARGNIRNFFYRYFQFELDFAYVALNYLCQGTAADLFKNRVNAIFYDRRTISAEAKMVTNIHDSVLARLPSMEKAQAYWEVVQELAGQIPNLSVPILVDGEVAIGNWGNIMKIQNNNIAETVALLKAKSCNTG